jgi:hypothetical protein
LKGSLNYSLVLFLNIRNGSKPSKRWNNIILIIISKWYILISFIWILNSCCGHIFPIFNLKRWIMSLIYFTICILMILCCFRTFRSFWFIQTYSSFIYILNNTYFLYLFCLIFILFFIIIASYVYLLKQLSLFKCCCNLNNHFNSKIFKLF